MRLALILALVAAPVAAQEARVIASAEGSFVGAQALSLETQTDRVAALEQQAFREFRWDVLEEVALTLQFDTSGASEAKLMVSADGDTFVPLAGTAGAGQVVSVLVTQAMTETEGRVSFPASEWSFELSVPGAEAPENGTFGPVLLPVEIGRDLGCETEGCGNETAQAEALPAVGGDPDSEPGVAQAPAQTGGADELARELQTELARIGCYTIAVDGLWGPGSRRAMAAYNAASGASLPEDAASARALVAVARETGTVCTQ